MRLRKRKLEMILSRLARHPSPRPSLEQYDLSPQAAAKAITWAWDNGDIQDRVVCDLGCGTGMLSIAAALSGAKRVVGVDLDTKALEVARENINIASRSCEKELSSVVEVRQADVGRIDAGVLGDFDTVVQNPPFGVQLKSSDRIFLRKALELAPVVYSIHKRSPAVERFVIAYIGDLGGIVEGKIPVDIAIPHQFTFHRKPSYVVAANLFRIRRKQSDKKKN